MTLYLWCVFHLLIEFQMLNYINSDLIDDCMKTGVDPTRSNDSVYVDSVRAQCMMTRDLKVAHVMGSLSAQQEGGLLGNVSSTVATTTTTAAAASWSSSDAPPLLLTTVQTDFVRDMVYCPTDLPYCLKNLLNPPTTMPKVVRQEYRMLTDDERTKYHNAVIKMKQTQYKNFSVNYYNLVASFHDATIIYHAHRSAAFYVWHRIYVLLYEKVLQFCSNDNTIAVPYFDWQLELSSEFPCQTNLFDNKFMGPGGGPLKVFVESGPFANFAEHSGALINRQCNPTARINGSFNDVILTTTKLYSELFNCDPFSIAAAETLHDRLHMFIGGTVSNTAKIPSDDPLFFSLHSYVELMLTTTLLRSGENETNYPATGCLSDKLMYMDYPNKAFIPFYVNEPNSPRDPVMFRSQDGMRQVFTAGHYSYAPRPSCPDSCEKSPHLFCNPKNQLCTAKARLGGRCMLVPGKQTCSFGKCVPKTAIAGICT